MITFKYFSFLFTLNTSYCYKYHYFEWFARDLEKVIVVIQRVKK